MEVHQKAITLAKLSANGVLNQGKSTKKDMV